VKNSPPSRVLIGAFELDVKAGELRCGNRTVRLQKKPCQVLLFLVEYGGEVVSREEIQKRLWPNDTVVDFEHAINTAIRKLRAAFEDSADSPKYIETLARRGYRLMVPVKWLSIAENLSSAADEPGVEPNEELRPSPQVEGSALAGTAPELSESSALIGRKLSHYRVLAAIGGGGMGVVYRAEDVKLGRSVALKVLPEELGGDSKALERFEREARAASALDHPNICSIYEFGEHQGQPFLAMQLLEGQTLRDRLTSAREKGDGEQALPLDELLDIAIQIARGLEAAHEKGIVHRDIKPANIFITTKGVAKILDFGVAKLTSAGDDAAEGMPRRDSTAGPSIALGSAENGESGNAEVASPATIERTLTRTGIALGTAGYMSPEQVRREKLDARTDLFSFGLVLYEMATGQRAFTGETSAILQDSIVNRTPVPVHDLNSMLPPRLQRLITKAMEKDRGLRHRSANEMREELEIIIGRSRYGMVRRHWKRALGALVLIAALVAGFLYRRSHRSVSLSEKDVIVLADFNNATGDAVFDGTLKQALAIQLEQSPFLNVLSDKQVNDTLKLMKHPTSERLTETTAQEVCVRSNSRAMISGSIAPAGNGYGIGLKTVDCQSGDTLATASGNSPDRNQILGTLADVANRLRQRLGESLGSVQQFSVPLEEATTSSLDALQAYTQGRRKSLEAGDAAALPYFKFAVELDSKFAYAYDALGRAHFGLYELSQAAANMRTAFELRDRVSPRERFSIQADYYDFVTGELDKVTQTYFDWTQTYPRDYLARSRLSACYRYTGQFDKALSEAQRAYELMPHRVSTAVTLMIAEMRMNRFAEAKAVYDEAHSQKLDSPVMQAYRYLIAFYEGDDSTMQGLVKSAAGRPLAEDLVLIQHSDTPAYHGKFEDSRQLSQQAIAKARASGSPERTASWQLWQALREAEAGNLERARDLYPEALKQSTGEDVIAKGALVAALVGDVAVAKRLVDTMQQQHPLDTGLNDFVIPMVRAAIALQMRQPGEAVEELKATLPYELGGSSICCLTSPYLRGLAFLQAGDGEQAQREFQKILDHPGIVENNVTGALAHLQCGRAQAMSGDRAAARKSYEDFLVLWKDADPDIPICKQAKAEYAKLQKLDR
jgi:serine/threonine protein kinase/DNA-binding winged helix-turn-helix (wHTH) protein/tetratricopeptide (TPR) repeat protein